MSDKFARQLRAAIEESYNKKASDVLAGTVPDGNYRPAVTYLRALQDVLEMMKRVQSDIDQAR